MSMPLASVTNMTNAAGTAPQTRSSRLVDAKGLLEQLFDARSRPSERWLRIQQKRRAIPFYRIGRLVRFDVEAVRAALNRRLCVHPPSERGGTGKGKR